jgi:DNA-binding MarR family transcriptional regulator
MQSNIIQPGCVSLESETKDTKFRAQFQIVFNGFLKSPCTMKELSVITGIDRSNICRYVDKLRDNNKISVYKRVRCTITRRVVNAYTTNPELMPISNQLKLF